MPFAIIGSVLFGTLIYILLQFAFLFALPKSAIGDTWDQVGDGLYTTMTGPFAEVATLLSIGWLATIIYIDAIISPAGTGLIYTTGSSRSGLRPLAATATSPRPSSGPTRAASRGSA